MATKVFLLDSTSEVTVGSETKKVASLIQGSSVVSTDATATVGGPTSGVQLKKGSVLVTWYSRPLRAVTISGTITFNLWGLESAAQANTGFDVLIERCDQDGNVLSTIVRSERGTELTTSAAVNNWTASPTSTSLNEGDRVKITVFGNDAGGNMGNGRTFTMNYGAGTGVNGDSYVQFNETISIGVVGTQTSPGIESSTIDTNLVVSESLPGVDGASIEELTTSTPVYAYFLDHDFTASDGTELSNYSEDGITYPKHPNFTVGSFTIEGNRLARDTQDPAALHYADVDSPTIYYEISCDIIDKSDISRTTGIVGWMDTSSDTQICLRRQNGSTWQFLKIINNVGTTITTAPETFSAEAIHSLRLRRIPGTNDFEPFIDNVSLGVFTINDPEFQSIGKVGLRATGGAQGPTAGFHLDNFKAFYEFVPNEQGAGTDSASVIPLISAEELGIGVESTSQDISFTLFESGPGTESFLASSSLDTSETAPGNDNSISSANIQLNEVSPGLEDASAENIGGDTFFVFGDEFGAGTESLSFLSQILVDETIPGSELQSIQNFFSISEGGISNDTSEMSALILSEEGFSGFDFVFTNPFVFGSEFGIGFDNLSVQFISSSSETFPGSETLQIDSSISVLEPGFGLDSVNIESPGQANAFETGAGNDSVFVLIIFTVNDIGAGIDSSEIASLISVNDSGIGLDSIQSSGEIFGEEVFIGNDGILATFQFSVGEEFPGTDSSIPISNIVIEEYGYGADLTTLSVNINAQQFGIGTDLASRIISGTLQISGKLRISIVNSNRTFSRVERSEKRTASVVDNGRTYSEVTDG